MKLRGFVFAIITILFCVFCGKGYAQTSQLIYEENFDGTNFESGWDNWSWSAALGADTSTSYRGTNCLKVNYSAQWGGLYFHDGNGFNTTGYDTLAFAINGYSAGGQSLTIQLKDGSGNVMGSVSANAYLAGGVVPANDWVTVTIPLAALNATNTRVYGVVIMNATPGATSLLIDSTRFDNAGIGFPGNIYSDAIAPGWLNYSWIQDLQMYGAGSARHGYKEIRAYFANQWDGIYFYNPSGIQAAGYGYLNFSVLGDQLGYDDLAGTQIQLRDINQNTFGSVQLSDYITGQINGAQWYDFSIPFGDFGVNSTDLIGGVVFMRSSSTYSTRLWLDDINFGAYRRYSASGNARRNVVLEAFYALHPQHDGGCDNTIGGDCVSSWNYLNDDATFAAEPSGQQDTSSYGQLKTAYGCSSSDWVTSTSDPCYEPQFDTHTYPVHFYKFPGNYGFGLWGGAHGAVGRGGQCTYFANLILWRAGAYKQSFPLLATMASNRDMNLQDAVEGDVLQIYNDPYDTNHVAIVVQIYRNNGSITGLDVIDADYIRDTSDSQRREVIARHLLSVSAIQGHYGIWKGEPYYGAPYVPD